MGFLRCVLGALKAKSASYGLLESPTPSGDYSSAEAPHLSRQQSCPTTHSAQAEPRMPGFPGAPQDHITLKQQPPGSGDIPGGFFLQDPVPCGCRNGH